MSETITRRGVAHAARLFAQDAGLTDGYGSRGRVSANVVLQYLQAQPAKTVREIAAAIGAQVTDKGKISEAEFIAVTDVVAKNAPKESGE
jgi:hypothetical protein